MRRMSFEQQARELLERFDRQNSRKATWPRPFMIELFGTPKSGKSTVKEMLKHFFKRAGWSVSTPTEGAEVVEWTKRLEPDYNFQTAEYALSFARNRVDDKRFHLVIFDRAIFDGVVRMEYYRRRGIITAEQQAIIEGYYTLPYNKSLFDLHICLVCDPETAIKRELARALTKKHGETMNPQTLVELHDAHQGVWGRLCCDRRPDMLWHDTSSEEEATSASRVLEAVLTAFQRR